MKNFRLTVHVADQPKVDTRAPKVFQKKGPQKSAVELAREETHKSKSITTTEGSKGRYKVYNTLSFYCNTMEDVHKTLADVKTKYRLQVGTDFDNKKKYGKELFNISNVK